MCDDDEDYRCTRKDLERARNFWLPKRGRSGADAAHLTASSAAANSKRGRVVEQVGVVTAVESAPCPAHVLALQSDGTVTVNSPVSRASREDLASNKDIVTTSTREESGSREASPGPRTCHVGTSPSPSGANDARDLLAGRQIEPNSPKSSRSSPTDPPCDNRRRCSVDHKSPESAQPRAPAPDIDAQTASAGSSNAAFASAFSFTALDFDVFRKRYL